MAIEKIVRPTDKNTHSEIYNLVNISADIQIKMGPVSKNARK